MGRPFLVEYDQTPYSRFFLCRVCCAHIARWREFVVNGEVLSNVWKNTYIFKYGVNLVTADPAHHRRVDNYTLADVDCTGCNKLLGLKFVQVAEPSDVVSEGRIILYPNELLFWNINQMLEASTMVPYQSPVNN